MRVFKIILFIVVLALGYFLYGKYVMYFKDNVRAEGYLYIRTGSNFDAVKDSLERHHLLENMETFVECAEELRYQQRIKPGKYRITNDLGNRKLLNTLLSGNQEPVLLTFSAYRLQKDFARFVSTKLEVDSTRLMKLLDSSAYIKSLGFTHENVYSIFIPNSYEFYWNTNADVFLKRMHKAYVNFWNKERLNKAKRIGLTPIQVSVLASIVDAEALKDEEMPMIAGLYINRLKKKMKLESDPTVIYTAKDFTIRRVLNKHLRLESQYNTYRHYGLPPGPIMMPSIHAIDAVLNYSNHSHIYMCAKEDFSGTHNFAQSLNEHQKNARRFQKALDLRNIKR